MCYYLLLKKRKRCNYINETQNNSKIIYFHPVHGEMRIFQLGHLYPYKGNDEMTPLYFSHPFLAFQNGAHRKFSMYFPDVR